VSAAPRAGAPGLSAGPHGHPAAGAPAPALGRAADLLEALLGVGVVGDLLLQVVRVVQDHREQVVEVVGHAAGQLAHGLEPLRLVQLHLQLLALALGVHVLGHVRDHRQ
jgi:hypothetical protein